MNKSSAKSPNSASTVSLQSHRYSGLRPWKPGQSGNPAGRVPGSRNKISEAFIRDLCTVWEESGIGMLRQLTKDDPAKIVAAILHLMPEDAGIETKRSVNDLAEEEILMLLEYIRAEKARIIEAERINASVGEKAQKESS